MTTLDDAKLREVYTGDFKTLLTSAWKDWRGNYLNHVRRVKAADRLEWLESSFQELLWDSNAVSNVGPGRSVTVERAYVDQALAGRLFDVRELTLRGNAEERGRTLQTIFDQTLVAVQDYNKRHPKARLVRLLATLFPEDASCIVDERRLWQVLRVVNLRPIKAGFVAHHPLLRERLREVLGGRPSMEEQVDQSIFTWFLWERFGKKPEEGAVVVDAGQNSATDTPTLALLPASVQRKGLVHVRENVPLLVAVVREAEQGITRADLIGVIQREAPHLKAAGSASNIISQAQGGLALIGLHDGAYRPTERGLELLSTPDAAQVLQPLLIGRIFGVGHLLLALKDKPEGLGQRALSEQLSTLIPTRKSLWSGSELIQWASASRLARQDAGKIYLTEDGAAYADALPDNFETEWRLEAPPEPGVGSDGSIEAAAIATAPPETEFAPATWEELEARFSDGDLSSRLILPEGLLAELHASLHASSRKRFVLLSGLSGTGKTSIARAYAEAYCRALKLPNWQQRYAQVAVRPDWTDPTGLLGFVNAVADPPSFQAAEALHLLLEADRDRGRPYFLCLDEMNLARVEHYFAPFLSAMEGEATTLALHGELEAIDNVEPRIAWPKNLFIFGTVNMDESTHPFSDKVLDRAFTFEFWDVDLEAWEARKRADGADGVLLDRVGALLRGLYGALEPARRHFGYRTADEVLAYCEAGSKALPLGKLLDGAILMKVLPRVRGDDAGPLRTALEALGKVTDPAYFPRTHRKIEQMKASLELTGQARFWS